LLALPARMKHRILFLLVALGSVAIAACGESFAEPIIGRSPSAPDSAARVAPRLPN